jgi:hydroxymethylpyrimidine pyrophosphatase-like HAD family hydrolase
LAIARAADHLDRLARDLDVTTVYTDLDGTLFGPGGSLFSHPDGPTGEPAAAVAVLARAGVDLIPLSGRTVEQTREVARVLGSPVFVAELGGVIVDRSGGTETVDRLTGAYRGPGTPVEAIRRSGVAGLLLEAFPGRLEPHAPWAHLPREVSALLRGNVAVPDVRTALEHTGSGWLDLVDNGIIPGGAERFPSLTLGPDEAVHAYHLLPRGVGKRAAVATDRGRRGLAREACIAVGDAPSDAEVADQVGAVFLVSNGAPAVEGLALPANVYLVARSHGLGFADAVLPFVRG